MTFQILVNRLNTYDRHETERHNITRRQFRTPQNSHFGIRPIGITLSNNENSQTGLLMQWPVLSHKKQWHSEFLDQILP